MFHSAPQRFSLHLPNWFSVCPDPYVQLLACCSFVISPMYNNNDLPISISQSPPPVYWLAVHLLSVLCPIIMTYTYIYFPKSSTCLSLHDVSAFPVFAKVPLSFLHLVLCLSLLCSLEATLTLLAHASSVLSSLYLCLSKRQYIFSVVFVT